MRTVIRPRRACQGTPGILARAALLLGLTAVAQVEASQVRPLNLEELTARADRIFSGRCVETETSAHALGFRVTRVTFEVERVVRGEVGGTLTVSMVTGDGAVRFEPGERAVVFLYGESALGLTSPVGLGQGKLALVRDKDGADVALSALGNRTLLRGLSPTARERVIALSGWEGRQGLPAAALLDAAEELVGLEAAGPAGATRSPAVPGGGR